MGHRYCLLKKIKCSFLEPSSLNFLQAYRHFYNFFQKRQKVQEWYLAVKREKAITWIRFLCVKRRKIHIFADKTLDLRQIDVTEHHFLNSQEPQGATLPCGCNLVVSP